MEVADDDGGSFEGMFKRLYDAFVQAAEDELLRRSQHGADNRPRPRQATWQRLSSISITVTIDEADW